MTTPDLYTRLKPLHVRLRGAPDLDTEGTLRVPSHYLTTFKSSGTREGEESEQARNVGTSPLSTY
eukprot:2375382-Prymnesium_polylepis.1